MASRKYCKFPKIEVDPWRMDAVENFIEPVQPRTHNQRVSFDIDVIYTRHSFLNNIFLRPSSVKSP
jgi:hypothetical protein